MLVAWVCACCFKPPHCAESVGFVLLPLADLSGNVIVKEIDCKLFLASDAQPEAEGAAPERPGSLLIATVYLVSNTDSCFLDPVHHVHVCFLHVPYMFHMHMWSLPHNDGLCMGARTCAATRSGNRCVTGTLGECQRACQILCQTG